MPPSKPDTTTSSLKSNLSYFFRPLLRILRMSNEPFPPEFEPVGANPISNWLLHMKSLCEAAANAGDEHRLLSLYALPVLKAWRIKKKTKVSSHEYVVVAVREPVTKETFYLKLHRVNARLPADPTTRPLQQTLHTAQDFVTLASLTSIQSTSESSSQSLLTSLANDTMSVSRIWKIRRDVGTLDFSTGSETQPMLLDLILAAHFITERYPNYALFSTQCYWYAGGVMTLLGLFAGLINIDTGNEDNLSSQEKAKRARAGRWGIIHLPPGDFKSLLPEFLEKRESFRREVSYYFVLILYI